MSTRGYRSGACRRTRVALVCALALLPVCAPAQQAQASGFTRELVRLTSGSASLTAELYRPAAAGPSPALVYDHGGAPDPVSRAAIERLGPFFAERGWAFLALQARGRESSATPAPGIGARIDAARAAGARRALPVIAGVSLAALVLALVVFRKRRRSFGLAAVVVLAAGATAYAMAGTRAGTRAMIESLESEPLADHLAAFAWLAGQSFVDANRIAAVGDSFGGIVTLLASGRAGYCAAINAAGAAHGWSASTELRRWLSRAARNARAPVLFFQAENDATPEPSRILSREVTNAGMASEHIVFPAFGESAEDARAFGWRGSAIWGDDVFRFLGRFCGTELVVTQPPYAVYSAFWLNLHHVLYSEAWRRRPAALERLAALLPEPLTAELTVDEQRAWEAAVDFYDRRIADRPLLFGLAATRQVLAAAGEAPPTFLPDPQHLEVLLAAAPVYRAHWWPAHDAANRAWIAAAMPRVAELSPEVPERLARLYRAPGFDRNLRVDVVRVAGVEGAYTEFQPAPAHVTISSSESNNQGWLAAEVLFHEVSHVRIGAVIEAIASASRTGMSMSTRDLWHAALFYSTGEVVRQSLESRGIRYEPYLYATGLLDRAWPNLRMPLETHWQSYVDGESSLEDAARALVAEIEGRPISPE